MVIFHSYVNLPEGIITGWWYTYSSEKCEFVSWGYYSQYMESHKIHVPNHQPVSVYLWICGTDEF